jgi:hypothetical protein
VLLLVGKMQMQDPLYSYLFKIHRRRPFHVKDIQLLTPQINTVEKGHSEKLLSGPKTLEICGFGPKDLQICNRSFYGFLLIFVEFARIFWVLNNLGTKNREIKALLYL